MHINKVENLIDQVIKDFYTVIIKNNKKVSKIRNEINFIKYQKDINEIISEYIKTLPTSAISNIAKESNSQFAIIDLLKRYIMIYFFLILGASYKGKNDVFINNIIEFSKNQASWNP